MKISSRSVIVIISLFFASIRAQESWYSQIIAVCPDERASLEQQRCHSINVGRQCRDHSIVSHSNNAFSVVDYASVYNNALQTQTRPNAENIIAAVSSNYKDSFEKRSWYDRHFVIDIPKEEFERVFYAELIGACGYNYSYEHLCKAHCMQMRSWKNYCYNCFRECIRTFPLLYMKEQKLK